MNTTNKKIPYMRDLTPLIQAGVDPKTGLPIKLGLSDPGYKNGIRTNLRIRDEQDAINRFVWSMLPFKLSSQELERLLYYRGQLAMFFLKGLEEFIIAPYTLCGDGLDWYGRPVYIRPVPVCQGDSKLQQADYKRKETLFSAMKFKVAYDVLSEEDITPTTYYDYAVILRDYTPQWVTNQVSISRQALQETIIDLESNCIPYMNTALKNSTGVSGIRVNSDDENSNVIAANKSTDLAALTGEKYIPITGTLDFQELTSGNVATAQEYAMAMQTIENFRLSQYGVDNGGLYSKNSYVNQTTESNLNGGTAASPLLDGLKWRQRFCDISYSIWGIEIDCQISESAIGADNGDGLATDEEMNHDETSSIGGENNESV